MMVKVDLEEPTQVLVALVVIMAAVLVALLLVYTEVALFESFGVRDVLSHQLTQPTYNDMKE
jgi:hypothetical protein